MPFHYDYTRLLVSNFKECLAFYRDVMSFSLIYGNEDDVYAEFETGMTKISLFNQQLMSTAIGTTHLANPSSVQDKFCLVFSVLDVDAFSRQLEEQGVQLVAGPENRVEWGIRTAHFRDPDGNLIEINQPLNV